MRYRRVCRGAWSCSDCVGGRGRINIMASFHCRSSRPPRRVACGAVSWVLLCQGDPLSGLFPARRALVPVRNTSKHSSRGSTLARRCTVCHPTTTTDRFFTYGLSNARRRHQSRLDDWNDGRAWSWSLIMEYMCEDLQYVVSHCIQSL